MKKYRLICMSLLLVGVVQSARGQLQRILHQSFEVDSANLIRLDLYGDFVAQTWSGNAVLTETQVKVYGATPGILEYALEQGRYDIQAVHREEEVRLESVDMIRPVIATSEGQSYEEVLTTVYIPDQFQPDSEQVWSRKAPLTFDEPGQAPPPPADTLASPEDP